MRSNALTSVLMMTIALAPASVTGRVGRDLGDAGSWLARSLGDLSGSHAYVAMVASPVLQVTAQPESISVPAPWADDDPADSLYRAARSALSDGDYRKAAALFGCISETFPKSAYAARALYYQAFALYRSGDGSDLHNALSALRQFANSNPANGSHGDAATLRTRICTALARQGDASCAERIAVQAESAAAPCPSDDDDNDVRIAALDGLLQMDADRAVPILRKVLARRDACSVGLRRKALFLVSQKESPETADILVSVARTDPEPELRTQAVFWLSQVQDPKVVPILDSIATHPGDEQVRERALFSLSQQSDTRSLDALRHAAESEDMPAELREKAVFWIGQSGGASSVKYLKDLFARTKDADIKEKVLFGVSQHGGEGDWLLGIGADPSVAKEIRKKAVFWAGQGDVGIGRFVNLYDRSSDQDIREQVIFTISQRSGSGAVDAGSMHIAKTDKDQEGSAKKKLCLRAGTIVGSACCQVPSGADLTMSILTTLGRYTTAAAFLIVANSLPAQNGSLESRVAGVSDGDVRMSFASRQDICGEGNSIMTGGRDRTISNFSSNSPDVEWDQDCEHGPVRLVLKIHDHTVTALHAYVGGRWRTPRDGVHVTDLGTVSANEGATYLLSLARRLPSSPGSDAIFPATLADSASVWPALAAIARDSTSPSHTRKQAVFWLGQAAGNATGTLDSLARDQHVDESVREQAVFALSQRPHDEGVPALIQIATSNSDPALRKKALFWLGESGDPRAIDVFEKILTK